MTQEKTGAGRPLDSYELLSFRIFTMVGALDIESNDPRASDRQRGNGASSEDIKALIIDWSITESIDSAAVQGKAQIIDGLGILYSVPIRGQERIEIKYRDFEGIEQEHKFIVYAVTDIEPVKSVEDSLISYTIHFVSEGKFISDRFRIRRAITSTDEPRFIPISDQAQVLYDDYYKDPKSDVTNDKKIEITTTEGPAQIVIPNMKPENAMRLLAKKAYSSQFPTQNFRFFESREKFYFVNMEKKMKLTSKELEEVKPFFYRSLPASVSGEDAKTRRRNIISMRLPNINTIEAINQGAYSRRVTEAHVMYRTIEDVDYRYYDEYNNYTYPNINKKPQPLHDEGYANKHLNYPITRYVLKDDTYDTGPHYPDAFAFRPQTHYVDIYNNRVPTFHHYSQTRMIIVINGYNDVFAGDTIKLEIPKFSPEAQESDQRVDQELSGYYLVEKVISNFRRSEKDDSFTQTLTVSRGGRN